VASISYISLTLKLFETEMLGVYLLQQVYPYGMLLFHRLYLSAIVGDGIKPKKFFHLILFYLCATENTVFKYTPSVNI